MRRWALVVLVIIAVVALVLWQRERARVAEKVSREVALRKTLLDLRGAIDDFHREHGRYPHSLEEAGPVPIDPITKKDDWRVTTEERVQPSEDFTAAAQAKPEVFVIEVHSSAPGTDSHGVRYGDY